MNYLPTTLSSSGLSNLLGKNGLAIADLFQRKIKVLRCVVAGTSFRNLHALENQLLPATKLSLLREPNNKHDEQAIKVLLDNYLLGYIPRSNNEVIASLMDAGKNFHAAVLKLQWQGSWAQLEVEVFMVD